MSWPCWTGIKPLLAVQTRCGYVAIVGRPNVGKSTLFNRLIGAHLSPVTPKLQTTRYNIQGVLTEGGCQMIFVDTPGFHRASHRSLNKVLNKNAEHALNYVDVAVLIVETGRWRHEDETVLKHVKHADKTCVLILNKCDRLRGKEQLLDEIRQLSQYYEFADVFPLSALKDRSFDRLKQAITELLPFGNHVFDGDQLCDKNERFLCAELIREQAMIELNQELPYAIHVATEGFTDKPGCTHVNAVIFVEKESQRSIVIGKQGACLKRIGTKARRKIEVLLGRKVFLQLWVKVNVVWRHDTGILNSYLDYSCK